MVPIAARLEAKPLYRRLDSLFGGLDPTRPQGQLVESFLGELFHALRDDLHLRGAALYAERRDEFELLHTLGSGTFDETLDPKGALLDLVFRHLTYVFATKSQAAVVVGRRPKRHVMLFELGPRWVMEELDFALNTVRAALGSRLVDEHVRGNLEQAAQIQQSLLLDEPPPFAGFDIACRSVAAEEVGGDFYDFHSFGDELLGVAIGDASGHGLPAALLVRDVVTGLRMGIEREMKVAYVFRKLNRVIHKSNLSSRFISVFYGELEPDGTLVYVNAGHPPPLLLDAHGAAHALATGGTVIGPLPDARFRRGHARLSPGSTLVMCTDGILERRDAQGEFFGEARLERVVRDNTEAGAAAMLERIYEAALAFGDDRPWEDDASVVVVQRPGAPVPAL
jgi:sigma-B regulation protein RsbU (phosphoserine phosphatase)